MAQQRVVVVGGGLAGLSATMKLAEEGTQVDLISMVPVKRSHSVCAQGGINTVNKFTRALGDTEWNHFDDTAYGGEFLNHQPMIKEMADWAPKIVHLADRLGVPFNRSPEGNLATRRFGGTLYKRTCYAGASTGQQLLYALDEQVRRWEAEGQVTKHEFWEFLGPVLDEKGICRGVIAQDMFTLELKSFPADAVILATGGCGLIFGKSTMSMVCTGGASSRAYKAGVKYANGEFVQVHPTAIPGADKLRLISEAARGEGGRVWVPRQQGDTRHPTEIPENERYYFLEERYPTYGNLVPRDIATREIFSVCKDGYSVRPDTYAVYLDLTEKATGLKPAIVRKKLDAILEIYEKFRGTDPLAEPMQIFPAVHYSMGGLWVDYEKDNHTLGMRVDSPRNQQTNIPGLFAIGEADYQFHGANRLGANSLLSCIFSGLVMGPTMRSFLKNLPGGSVSDTATALFDQELAKHRDHYQQLINRDENATENPYKLHQELGELMTQNCTVVRNNADLAETVKSLDTIADRYKNCALSDRGTWTNQNLSFTRALGDMIDLAKVIAKGALQRNECRGAHYKPEFSIPSPEADDHETLHQQADQWCQAYHKQNDEWLKTTIAQYDPAGPKISYEPVDTEAIPPRPRTYGLKGAEIIDEVWKEKYATKSKKDELATAETKA